MTTQYELFAKTLDQRFEDWFYSPRGQVISRLFIDEALKLKRAGRVVGSKAITEHLRYEPGVPGDGGEYKINNSFVSRLARKAMERCQELEGYFVIHELG